MLGIFGAIAFGVYKSCRQKYQKQFKFFLCPLDSPRDSPRDSLGFSVDSLGFSVDSLGFLGGFPWIPTLILRRKQEDCRNLNMEAPPILELPKSCSRTMGQIDL